MSNLIGLDFVDVSFMAASLLLKHSVHFQDDTRRQLAPGSAHHDTQIIILRGPKGGANDKNWQADVEHEDYGLLYEWASARHVVDKIAAAHVSRGNKPPQFGKIMVVSLKAGGHVDWHVDHGAYAQSHDRFHLCLVASPGAWLYSGGYGAILPPGQLTWFNNHVKHSAINMGPIDRVHLIADIRRETMQ